MKEKDTNQTGPSNNKKNKQTPCLTVTNETENRTTTIERKNVTHKIPGSKQVNETLNTISCVLETMAGTEQRSPFTSILTDKNQLSKKLTS